MNQTFQGASGFQFSGAGVNIVAKAVNRAILPVLLLDATGSIANMGAEALVQSILTRSIQELRAKGIHEGGYVAAWYFNSKLPNYLQPVVPFAGIDDVDTSRIPTLVGEGMTPMYGATYRVLDAANTYGKALDEEGVTTDAFCVLVTDGFPEGNDDKTAADVKAMLAEIRTSTAETRLASIYFAVIGVGAPGIEKDVAMKAELMRRQGAFATEIGADLYHFAGDLAGGTIGKIIGWFSSSVQLSQRAGNSVAADFSTT